MAAGPSNEIVFPKKTSLKRNIGGGIAGSFVISILFAFLAFKQYQMSPADATNALVLLGFFLLFFLGSSFLYIALNSSYVLDKSTKSFIHRLFFLGINFSSKLGTCDQVMEVKAQEERAGNPTSGKILKYTVLVTFSDGSIIEVEDFPDDQLSKARECANSLRAIISPEKPLGPSKTSKGPGKGEEPGKSSRDKWVLISMGGLCVFFGGMLTWVLFQDVLLVSIASMKWVKTPCTIRSSEVIENVSSNRAGKVLSYSPKISYSYQFEGKAFVSDWFAAFPPSFLDRGACKLVVDKFPERSTQSCFVDARNPQNAVLDRSLNTNIAWAIIPLSVFLFGILFVIAGLMR